MYSTRQQRGSGDLKDSWTVMSSQTHPGYGKCADIRSIVMLMALFERDIFFGASFASDLMLIWDVCLRLAPCLSPNQSVSKLPSQTSA